MPWPPANKSWTEQAQQRHSLSDLIEDFDVLTLGESHLDRTLAHTLVTEAKDLRDAGVTHVILEIAESPIIQALNEGRVPPRISINPTGRGRNRADDIIYDGNHMFDVGLAMSNVGVTVVAGNRSRNAYQEASKEATKAIPKRHRFRTSFNMTNREMSGVAASLVSSGRGKVIILAGHAHTIYAEALRKTISIPDRLNNYGIRNATVRQLGGIGRLNNSSIGEAALASTQSNTPTLLSVGVDNAYWLAVPRPRQDMDSLDMVWQNDNPERVAKAIRKFYDHTSLADLLIGVSYQRNHLPDIARQHFLAGAQKGEPTMFIDAARASYFMSNYTDAQNDLEHAVHAGVPAALALQQPFAALTNSHLALQRAEQGRAAATERSFPGLEM